MGFLKTILIIILVYYLFKILVKWFGLKLFNYAAKKTEAHFRGQYGGFAEQGQTKEEPVGKVSFDKKHSPKSNLSKKVGEYIDFEEVE